MLFVFRNPIHSKLNINFALNPAKPTAFSAVHSGNPACETQHPMFFNKNATKSWFKEILLSTHKCT